MEPSFTVSTVPQYILDFGTLLVILGLQIANHRPSYDALLKQYMDEGWIKNYEYTCDASPNGTTYKAAVILTLEGNTTVECRGEGPDSTTAVERAGEEAVRVVWRRRNKISGSKEEALVPLGGMN